MSGRPRLIFKGTGAPRVVVAPQTDAAEAAAGAQTEDLTLLVPAKVESSASRVLPDVAPAAAAPKPVKPAAAAAAPPKPQVISESSSSSDSNSSSSDSNSNSDSNSSNSESNSSESNADSNSSPEGTKYSPKLQEFANDILGEETGNPYKTNASSVYPLRSRLGFEKQILKVFSEFINVPDVDAEPDFDACKKIGASSQSQVTMYEYQKFVRDYLRQASPYRGLLVYHGLGSGKTCSAIAAAEGLFSVTRKKIIVMTPSSLRDNFIREVTFCGFRHFRLQNHWVKLNAKNRLIRLFATEILSIPQPFINKAENIWVPDFKKESNFNTLDSENRQEITNQVMQQINSRIEFINYNGISATKLKEIACRPVDANGYGYFDNAVIVVDEFHNLTRLMQGTIEPYLTSLPGLRRKVPVEPVTPGHWTPALCKKGTVNYKRVYLFYRLLVGARNSKIIALSGTPLINFPEEISIISNLLGGYIHTASFSTNGNDPTILRTILKENPFVDFEEVEIQGTTLSVLFTLLPEGMTKVYADGTLGVQRVPSTPSIQEVYKDVLANLKKKIPSVRILREAEFKSEPLLPPVGEEFRENFLNKDGTTLTNTVVLRKRLQGLISYYKGSKKELMPLVTVDTVVRVPLSPYAQLEYQRIRSEELKQQLEQKKPAAVVPGVAGKMGNLWAEMYDLARMKSPNSYRMFSRQACNFAFPEGITRPRPHNQTDVSEELGADTEIIDTELSEEPVDKKESAAEAAEIAEAAKEDEDIDKEAVAAAVADAKGAGDEEEAEAIVKEGDGILIKELPAVPATGDLVPVAAAAAAAAPAAKKTLTAANVMRLKQKKDAEDCKRGLGPGENYLVATARAKKCLETFATPRLRLYPRGKKVADEFKAGVAPDPTLLNTYSPKFAKILEKVLEINGSSLVYSQFLDMEGIGIFLVILKINEFQPITFEEGDGVRFSAKTIESLKKGPGVNRYLSFTGKESRQVRSMALRVFNAKYSDESGYSELPEEISKVLIESGFKGNLNGELCKVFCITSAGAEGLSLRNVRRVHIMEPYWNHVRTDQVKGRAVRICSHIDLEYNPDPKINQRTVEVYTYCSVYNVEALLKPDGSGEFPRIDQTILNGDGVKPSEAKDLGFDVPAGITDYVITSDEYLYQLSERKKKVLQSIQDLMKTSAVDCQINQYENEEKGCITIPGTPEQYAYHPILKKDIAETVAAMKEEPAAPAAAAAAAALDTFAGPASTLPVAKPPVASKIKAYQIKYGGKKYTAVPEGDAAIPLSYTLFAPGDTGFTVPLGTSVANSKGKPTSDIALR